MLEDLRLLILIIGILAIGLLIVDGFRRRQRKNKPTEQFEQTIFQNTHGQQGAKDNQQTEFDPLFADMDDASSNTQGSIQDKSITNPNPISPDVKPSLSKAIQEVITISIYARHKGGFSGRTLESALRSHFFYFGEKNIYHRHVSDNPENPIVYSIAQATEPGHFDVESLKTQRIQGIVIFMILPMQNQNPVKIFDQMLKSARQLAAALNGELCDEQRHRLTSQTIEHCRERILDHHRKMLAVPQQDGSIHA